MFKLAQCAEQNWRKLRGFDYLAKVITGVTFRDELKPQTQTRSPHDRQASNTRFDNKSEQQSYVGEDILFGNLSLGGEQQELPKQNWSKQK